MLKIVDNYVIKRIRDIQDRSKLDITLDCAYQRERKARFINRSPIKFNPDNNNLNDSTELKEKPKVGYTTKFTHCGWNYSKRLNCLIVENNATTSKALESCRSNKSHFQLTRNTAMSDKPATAASTVRFHTSKINMHSTLKHQNLLRGINSPSGNTEKAQHIRSASQQSKTPSQSTNLEQSVRNNMKNNNNVSGISSKNKAMIEKANQNRQTLQTAESMKSILSTNRSNFSEKSYYNLLQMKSTCSSANDRQIFLENEYVTRLVQDNLSKEWNQKEIRTRLHPRLADEYLPKVTFLTYSLFLFIYLCLLL